MTEVMLSTIDNPYNPFVDYDKWYAFDTAHGYNSCAYLARIAKTSDDLSELDEEQAIEEAVDSIVSLNVLGIYFKLTKDNFISQEQRKLNRIRLSG